MGQGSEILLFFKLKTIKDQKQSENLKKLLILDLKLENATDNIII